MIVLNVKNYDLELTFYPSFIITMFRKIHDYHWIKIFGNFKNISIKQNGDKIYIEGNIDFKYIQEILGIWYNPINFENDVSMRFRDLVHNLVDKCLKIRLAVFSLDKLHIFISTFLSRNTDYYTNVIRWVQKLLELTNDNPDKISEVEVSRVGNSYQLKQLPEALIQYLNNVYSLHDKLNPWELRKELLSIRYVGPKVAHAYLLFTGKCTFIAPSDKHYIRFIRRLKIFDEIEIPNKNLCIKYSCDECPRNKKCLTGLSYLYFHNLSAWIQTIAYVIDRMFCSKNLCKKCLINDLCKVKQ